jgi:hypothetical protein
MRVEPCAALARITPETKIVSATPVLAARSSPCGFSRYNSAAPEPLSCCSTQCRSQILLTDRTAVAAAVSQATMATVMIRRVVVVMRRGLSGNRRARRSGVAPAGALPDRRSRENHRA